MISDGGLLQVCWNTKTLTHTYVKCGVLSFVHKVRLLLEEHVTEGERKEGERGLEQDTFMVNMTLVNEEATI